MAGLRRCQIVPDLDGARFIVTPSYYSVAAGCRLRATLLDGEKAVATAESAALDGVPLVLPVADPRPWSPASASRLSTPPAKSSTPSGATRASARSISRATASS